MKTALRLIAGAALALATLWCGIPVERGRGAGPPGNR